MIKVVYCITKKQGLTDQDFFNYWKNIHGPVGARIPGLRRLVQNHRIAIAEDQRQPDYDGVAELWFDDISALLAARRSPEWKASTLDESNFIDHQKVAYLITYEEIILDTPR
ncbi:MAG TPA: EthD domain-containing protein [Terriglobales bacterium]|nr:EthD domain-containing protein [Terriglobales bacterium]